MRQLMIPLKSNIFNDHFSSKATIDGSDDMAPSLDKIDNINSFTYTLFSKDMVAAFLPLFKTQGNQEIGQIIERNIVIRLS